MANEILSFEKAFERLEQILETMNANKTPLEESLKLFEEAEKLIRTCTGRLTAAEQKIETLIKGRNGEIVLDAEQKPKVENYAKPPRPAGVSSSGEVHFNKAQAPTPTQMDELPF